MVVAMLAASVDLMEDGTGVDCTSAAPQQLGHPLPWLGCVEGVFEHSVQPEDEPGDSIVGILFVGAGDVEFSDVGPNVRFGGCSSRVGGVGHGACLSCWPLII